MLMLQALIIIISFHSSLLKVTSFEGNMQLSDFEADLCSKKSIPDNFKVTMYVLGIPCQCSYKQNGVFCYKSSEVMRLPDSFRRMLKYFDGKRELLTRIDMRHDTGKSCIEYEVMLEKKIPLNNKTIGVGNLK
ncbi:CLUMA_CG013821, isoform A [Clunio marinus]|uniref:CLUMA_CG013821, isoform A n=1 Tax=Clunio marinus TaxID=568069 RepID=A0A1J1IPY1_9DIPT|nr:CLUMA_CG013821, isoform A [Clunio marinus]